VAKPPDGVMEPTVKVLLVKLGEAVAEVLDGMVVVDVVAEEERLEGAVMVVMLRSG